MAFELLAQATQPVATTPMEWMILAVGVLTLAVAALSLYFQRKSWHALAAEGTAEQRQRVNETMPLLNEDEFAVVKELATGRRMTEQQACEHVLRTRPTADRAANLGVVRILANKVGWVHKEFDGSFAINGAYVPAVRA